MAAFLIVCLLAAALGLIAVWDFFQTRHTVLRNYPLIGHFRYLLERVGDYLRPSLLMNDTEDRPFDRATRGLAYSLAKDQSNLIAFGSVNDLREPGSFIFVTAPYALLDAQYEPVPPRVIGADSSKKPFEHRSLVNISGMSYGSISEAASRALARGAAQAGCWFNVGEGGLAPFHLEGGASLILQVGTAKFGLREADGSLSARHVREAGEKVSAFEIKLSQGAEPGYGSMLPARKVTEDIARIRGIPAHQDIHSPARHADAANVEQLLDLVNRVRDLGGRPVGIKTALGNAAFMQELCEAILRRGPAQAPDFITVDGSEGGSAAAPKTLMDHAALPIAEALPLAVDALMAAGLRGRVAVVASGKLVTPARAAWALCMGADFVNTARGFMFALGCIQARRCNTDTCPTGITTQDPRRQRGLVVADKAARVAHYGRNLNRELEMIAHACGCAHPRLLARRHVRIVQTAGVSMPLDELYPYPDVMNV